MRSLYRVWRRMVRGNQGLEQDLEAVDLTLDDLTPLLTRDEFAEPFRSLFMMAYLRNGGRLDDAIDEVVNMAFTTGLVVGRLHMQDGK